MTDESRTTLQAPPLRPNAATDELLHVDHLCISSADGSREILSGVSFSMRKGEIFAVAGESGSGKTTLACAMTNVLPSGAYRIGGRVMFRGMDLLSADAEARRGILRKDIRYLFQEPGQSLNPIARIGAQMQHVFDQGGGAAERFDALLDSFGLGDHRTLMRAYPHELSIGTLQRILMAAALAPRPALLIADEPTSSVDFVLKHAIMRELRMLSANEGMSVIFITHDLPLARRYAHRLSVLADGRLAASE